MPPGVDGALDTLSSSVLGALVVVLAIACAWLSRKLGEVQEARVADAQRVAAAALEREEKWQTVLVDLTNAVERMGHTPAAVPALTPGRRP